MRELLPSPPHMPTLTFFWICYNDETQCLDPVVRSFDSSYLIYPESMLTRRTEKPVPQAFVLVPNRVGVPSYLCTGLWTRLQPKWPGGITRRKGIS